MNEYRWSYPRNIFVHRNFAEHSFACKHCLVIHSQRVTQTDKSTGIHNFLGERNLLMTSAINQYFASDYTFIYFYTQAYNYLSTEHWAY